MNSSLAIDELTPEMCHKLRDSGFLQLLVHLQHSHTIRAGEPTKLDPKSLIDHYQQKLNVRKSAAKLLRKIVINTCSDKLELEVFKIVENLRSYVDDLLARYGNSTSDCYVIRICTQLTEILSNFNQLRGTFETFGGLYAIVDLLAAQCLFHSEECVKNHCVRLRVHAIRILQEATLPIDGRVENLVNASQFFISMFMDQLRSNGKNLHLVRAICRLMFLVVQKENVNYSVIIECEVAQCLMETAMNTQNWHTIHALFGPVAVLMMFSQRMADQFYARSSTVEYVINSFVTYHSREKHLVLRDEDPIIRDEFCYDFKGFECDLVGCIVKYFSFHQPILDLLWEKRVSTILVGHLTSLNYDEAVNACYSLIFLVNISARERSNVKSLGTVDILKQILIDTDIELFDNGFASHLLNILLLRPGEYKNIAP